MQIKDLQSGQIFKVGRQRKYRQFLESRILEGKNIPEKHQGKLLVFYDNCKQMVVDPDMEVTEFRNPRFPVVGYGPSYSTGDTSFGVVVLGIRTSVAHLLKDGSPLVSVYTIQNMSCEFVEIDIDDIPNFPCKDPLELRVNGLKILRDHINSNPEEYERYI